jgi:hypothetical protein
MRKRIISQLVPIAGAEPVSLDLEKIASVEVTSEDIASPIESALAQSGTQGWRAGEPGVQTIRLIFDQPQNLERISLEFVDTCMQRTQEFTLRWSPDQGSTFHEIARQQWNFSSPDATREMESYAVELSHVTLLELIIEPDKENKIARASLSSLRIA